MPSNFVGCIEIDEIGNKWIGTKEGLAKFDGINWTVYDTTNSALPSNEIWCMTIDNIGNKWIISTDGDSYALSQFDGANWEIIQTPFSPNWSTSFNCLSIDESENKWIGASEGLAKFDGTNWTVYTTTNSPLPFNYIRCLTIDKIGNKWIISAYNGDFRLSKFDGTNWTINYSGLSYYSFNVRKMAFDSNNSLWTKQEGLDKFDGTIWTHYPSPISWGEMDGNCIAIDKFDNKWIGVDAELLQFVDTTWTIYNNPFPNQYDINEIEIDKLGNKWFGTSWFGFGLDVFNETGVVVPVELNSFTAATNGKEVTLSWSTATELNNHGFEVQRRFRNSDFATIGSVKGHGTTTSPNQYSYVDKLTDQGKYFYRLKQIDYVGTFEYSNEIEVEVRLLDKFTLEKNYPNPFNPTTKIGYVLRERSNAKFTLLNALGEEIAVLVNEEQDRGYHKVELDGSKLSSGVYFYQLQAGEFVSTKKMLLLR